MLQAVKSNLFLCADDSCLAFQVKDVIETEKQLNRDFTNNCERSVDNRLKVHFGKLVKIGLNSYFLLLNIKIPKHKSFKTKCHIRKYTNQATFKGQILRLYIR